MLYLIVDGNDEPWFASDDWDEIIERIEEHEMMRILPDGKQIYKEKQGIEDFPTGGELSPHRFDVVLEQSGERRSAWSIRTGWLKGKKSFNDLADPISNLN